MTCEYPHYSMVNGYVQCILPENHPGDHRNDSVHWSTEEARPSDRQVGGDHYKGGSMQPIDVIDAFGLNFYEGSALKYLLRWRKKNGIEDLQKAIHYIELQIEREGNN